jgi:DNA-binding HxlR family transcriptional regulator
MTSSKIDFHHRRVHDLEDLCDFIEMFFPNNPNQQHAAGRILLSLKEAAPDVVASFASLERDYLVSRRTLQRTRAKLSRLGLIERLGRPGQGTVTGWRLSGRMSTSLRRLADKLDLWRSDRRPIRRQKDSLLLECLQ